MVPHRRTASYRCAATLLALLVTLEGEAEAPSSRTAAPLVLRTLTQQGSGPLLENLGSGVVFGPYFVTVYHNLDPLGFRRDNHPSRSISYLGAVPVEALYTDIPSDIAVLSLPDGLCHPNCAELPVWNQTLPSLSQRVRWFSSSAPGLGEAGEWRQAWVVSRTVIRSATVERSLASQLPQEPCPAGLVYELDTPFPPGSSGTGVFDLQGLLIGIAQGSYQYEDGRVTGYFRPWSCIARQWPPLNVPLEGP